MTNSERHRQDMIDLTAVVLSIHSAILTLSEALPPEKRDPIFEALTNVRERLDKVIVRLDQTDATT